MKVLHKTVIVVATVSLLLLLFYLSVMPIAMSKWFYMMNMKTIRQMMHRYSMEELSEITDIMLDYLKDKRDSMQHEINGKEVYSEQAIIIWIRQSLICWSSKIGMVCSALFIASIIYIVYYFKELPFNENSYNSIRCSHWVSRYGRRFAAVNFDVAFLFGF